MALVALFIFSLFYCPAKLLWLNSDNPLDFCASWFVLIVLFLIALDIISSGLVL